jgi:hypothetical protein
MFMPPMAMAGQWLLAQVFNVMNDDFLREIHSNKAFLGVMTKKVTDRSINRQKLPKKALLKKQD